MESLQDEQQRILVAGCNKLAISICICLLKAAHEVTLWYTGPADAETEISVHVKDVLHWEGEIISLDKFRLISNLEEGTGYDMVIASTNEDLDQKMELIAKLEGITGAGVPIAINMESIDLSSLQEKARHPSRIIGANWVEPAHTTFFLEIITNGQTNQELSGRLFNTAKQLWNKDPYLIKTGKGIRSRMMGALVREAFYLIDNNIVSVEDIDRACRNDAGYYLPFAGNFRYMDLMGTYIYGVVMSDLNRELTTITGMPEFCRNLIEKGSKGMQSGEGFYKYKPGEAEEWEQTCRKFSYQIRQIIHKYSFIHNQQDVEVGA